jgi:hypothetical protein
MKKLILLLVLPFISLAQSTLITAGTSGNVNLPNLTYNQILAIPSPQKGMQTFDTDYGCVRIYNGTSWRCHDTPQNQPNVTATAVKADNSSTVQQTYTDLFTNGSAIVTGNFFGSITFGSTTLTSAGTTDIFMVKYDANGAVLWALRIGGAGNGTTLTGDDVVTDVAVEAGSQNFYIIGRIGSVSLTGAMTGTTANGTDGFIAKFDANGTLLWSSFFTGTASSAYEGLTAMSVLGSDIYVCGYQSGGASLGSIALGATNSNFVAKYSASGTAQWAYELSGASITEIACNSSRVAITGSFFSAVNLGGTTYTTTGLYDAFVLCLDNVGAFQWGQSLGSTGADFGKAIIFRNNKIVLAGTYNGPLAWGTTTLSNVGNDDIFLLQYDLSGNKEWIKGFNGISTDNVAALKTDILGNLYLLGSMGNRLWLGNQVLTNASSSNVFVAKFDPTGDCIWAKVLNSNNSIYGIGLSATIINGFTKLCVSGYFQGTNVQFGHTKLTSGNTNMFLATLTEN